MNCNVEVDPDLRSFSQEILRRRILGGEVKSDLRNTIADMALMKLYERQATLDDFKAVNNRFLNFITEDDKGCEVRVINGFTSPYRVYSTRLDADIYVFSSTSKDYKTCTFHGWLDRNEVEEAPVYWFEEDGERTDYCHEVDKIFLYPMPVKFNFNINCDHRFATWDYMNNGWNCSACEKLCYDIQAYRSINAAPVSG